jgi:hypothetical protein
MVWETPGKTPYIHNIGGGHWLRKTHFGPGITSGTVEELRKK